MDEVAHHRLVIARHDLDPDAGGREPRNGICRARLGRIDKDAEAGQDQVAFVVGLQLRAIRRHRLPGNGQQPVAAGRLRVLHPLDILA